MSHANGIKKLLDQGNYLEASKLADKHKITDCRNFCQRLSEINEIASSIDHSTSIVSSLSDKITSYESELKNIKDTAFQMEEREHAVQVLYKNYEDTCNLIDELLQNLRIPDHIQELPRIMMHGDLYDRNFIERIDEALEDFQRVLQYQPDPVLLEMQCIRDQREHAYSIKSRIGELLYQHFIGCIDSLFSQHSEGFINHIYSQAITLPGHDVIHNELQLYLEQFVHWTGRNDRDRVYTAMNDYYIARSKAQYDKEFKVFFECAKERMNYPIKHGRLTELNPTDSRKRNSMNSGDNSTRASSLSGGGGGTLDSQDTASGKSSEISYGGWGEFDADFDRMLRALDPTCRSEQQFYSSFFPAFDEDSDGELTIKKLVHMFSQLSIEFIEFANYYNNQNGLYSLYLLTRLSQYLSTQSSSNNALLRIYREVTIIVKRNFDTFMKQQLNSIRELKAPKQSKCGVLSAVKNFEQFAKQVEQLFANTGSRRSEVDRYYSDLVTELFKTIERIEHNRTPTEMIRLENYKYLHDVLSLIKVPCLKTKPREAKAAYEAALNAYVTRYFGRPLEKVNIFFDGVQAKVAQGVKEDEISFQLAFSKQELRKVLQMVTLKEVRKGLEEMYRRIEKHAYEPKSNLIEVIWHAMQSEFLSQYKAIQGMIERCYPGSNLSLMFSIEDVLQVFSDIAQSH